MRKLYRWNRRLDAHDDLIASMTLCIQKLIALLKPPPDSKIDNRKIPHTQTQPDSGMPVNNALGTLNGDAKDVPLLQLHEEQLGDTKKDISDVKIELMSLNVQKSMTLVTKQS